MIIAIGHGNIAIADALIKAGANINEACAFDASILIFAVRTRNTAGVFTLLRAGVDTEICDGVGNTALIYALTHGNDDSLRALLYYRANIDIVNNNGHTADSFVGTDTQKQILAVSRDKRHNTRIPLTTTTV